MRIAMFAWESLYSVAIGGAGVYVSKLAEALFARGHQVHVITRLGPNQRMYDNVFGVEYHRCPFAPHENFVDETRGMCESFSHYFSVVQERTGAFDQLHCHEWMTVRAGLTLAQAQALPLTMTFHTTELGRAGAWPSGGEPERIAQIERMATESADTIIAVNHQVRRELGQLYQCPDHKLSVIYPGISLGGFDNAPFDPGAVKQAIGIDPMAPTILFAGRLNHRKGADLLIDAAPKVLEKHPHARFLLVGEGDQQEHLEREVERYGIGDAVRFLGWKNGRELVDLYRACDLVACPSRTDIFGSVVLSAWAAAKPIVATRTGVPEEIIKHEDTGWLIAPESTALARTILAGFEDFENLRWVGRNGRVAVETAFVWPLVAEKTEAVYRARQPAPGL